MSIKWRQFAAPLLIALAPGLWLTVGCGQTSPSPSTTSVSATDAAPNVSRVVNQASPTKEEGHGHKPGAHGGLIVSIGLDSYHAEAVLEKGGVLKLLMLGQDESRILEVEKQTLKAYVKAANLSEAVAIDVQPMPQDGDTEGKTSQFVAQLPQEVLGEEVDVTVPNIRINGERFRIGFTTRKEEHTGGHDAMPGSVAASEEEQLYLTPGGKYTLADIAANGNMAASRKFKGIPSNHNAKPQIGDKLCPISMTKANPDFGWVIDGQTYEFCCPPCVDEYVKLAKERPEELQPAASFVKK